jgi:hypothetical protein
MSALGQKRTSRRGAKSTFVRYGPIAGLKDRRLATSALGQKRTLLRI